MIWPVTFWLLYFEYNLVTQAQTDRQIAEKREVLYGWYSTARCRVVRAMTRSAAHVGLHEASRRRWHACFVCCRPLLARRRRKRKRPQRAGEEERRRRRRRCRRSTVRARRPTASSSRAATACATSPSASGSARRAAAPPPRAARRSRRRRCTGNERERTDGRTRAPRLPA